MTGLGHKRSFPTLSRISEAGGKADEISAKPDITSQVSCLHDALKPRCERRYMRQTALAATGAAEPGLWRTQQLLCSA